MKRFFHGNLSQVKLSKQWQQLLAPALWLILILILIVIWLSGCSTPPPTPPILAKEVVVYGWAGYMPQSVLDAFTKESGVKVNYVVYDTQEEALTNIRAGQSYDVVVMGSEYLRDLITTGLLAELDYRHIPNFKNISANFRDLAYDPGNKHSIMFEWGTTGLIVRTDLVEQPVTRWADLWDKRYAGKVGIWAIPHNVIGLTLKSLGYSINSENPAEFEAVLQRLLELKKNVFFMDLNEATSAPYLIDGRAVLVFGWPYDILEAREQSDDVAYVLPQEGALLWGDNLTIPANSPNKYTAELFIDFLLRPEISAQITNEIYIPTPNEAARPFIKPEILNDPVIFPPDEDLRNAEIIIPRTPQGQKLYDEVWQRFMDASPQEEKP